MWLYVMFDLPTTTKAERRAYAKFRKDLLKDGFTMLQFSVYVRHCASFENGTVHQNRVRSFLPQKGKVSVLTITDKQYSAMITYWGKRQEPRAASPQQLEMF